LPRDCQALRTMAPKQKQKMKQALAGSKVVGRFGRATVAAKKRAGATTNASEKPTIEAGTAGDEEAGAEAVAQARPVEAYVSCEYHCGVRVFTAWATSPFFPRRIFAPARQTREKSEGDLPLLRRIADTGPGADAVATKWRSGECDDRGAEKLLKEVPKVTLSEFLGAKKTVGFGRGRPAKKKVNAEEDGEEDSENEEAPNKACKKRSNKAGRGKGRQVPMKRKAGSEEDKEDSDEEEDEDESDDDDDDEEDEDESDEDEEDEEESDDDDDAPKGGKKRGRTAAAKGRGRKKARA